MLFSSPTRGLWPPCGGSALPLARLSTESMEPSSPTRGLRPPAAALHEEPAAVLRPTLTHPRHRVCQNLSSKSCPSPAVARTVHRDCFLCLASVFFSCARLRRRSSRTIPLRAATPISSAHDRFNLFDESFDKHRSLLTCGRALAAALASLALLTARRQ